MAEESEEEKDQSLSVCVLSFFAGIATWVGLLFIGLITLIVLLLLSYQEPAAQTASSMGGHSLIDVDGPRKLQFMELVRLERKHKDQGSLEIHRKALLKRWGLREDAWIEIGLEGARKGWSVPVTEAEKQMLMLD